MPPIRKSTDGDTASILAVVNAAAQAYRGIIPADRWHEPYMPLAELESEIADGVVFWVAEEDGRMSAVMGIQDKGDVALVRHAYVMPSLQRKGMGTSLLRHVRDLTPKPVLIGTWADASWAIEFYLRNGFNLVPTMRARSLLRKYWSISERQIETSVVLADESMDQNAPRFEFLMNLAVDVGDVMSMGAAPLGERRVVSILGGTFEGPGMRGEVLPGGADWQIARTDGVLDIDASYVLKEQGGGLVRVISQGYRYGSSEVLAALARGEDVDPSRYFFRAILRFETGAPYLESLNRTIAVATAERQARKVLLSAYRLL
jgi:GNAT superfamily N-acetyltransferase